MLWVCCNNPPEDGCGSVAVASSLGIRSPVAFHDSTDPCGMWDEEAVMVPIFYDNGVRGVNGCEGTEPHAEAAALPAA
eukprot:12884939-Prorocentrum_lima.AAC.1